MVLLTIQKWEDQVAPTAKWIPASRDEPVADVAVRSLKARLKLVQRFLPLAATRAEEDVEYVHQLRVWTRRAQAAIEMYRRLLPEWRAAWVEKQLTRIRRKTNDARDADVFAARLLADAENPAAAHLLQRVRQHRCAAQQSVLKVYQRLQRDDRFAGRVGKMLGRVRLRGKDKQKQVPFGRWAARRFRPLLKEFYAAAEADFSDIQALHQFRISTKKLRYATELLGDALVPEFRQQIYPVVTQLQDKLGAINDHATAQDRVRDWIGETNDPREVQYLEHMLVNEESKLEQCLQEFFCVWTPQQEESLRDAFHLALAGEKRAGGFFGKGT